MGWLVGFGATPSYPGTETTHGRDLKFAECFYFVKKIKLVILSVNH